MFHTLLDAPHVTVVDFLQGLFCLLVLSMQVNVDLPVLVTFFSVSDVLLCSMYHYKTS